MPKPIPIPPIPNGSGIGKSGIGIVTSLITFYSIPRKIFDLIPYLDSIVHTVEQAKVPTTMAMSLMPSTSAEMLGNEKLRIETNVVQP